MSHYVLSKFIDLCMETPCWCPPGGNQHGGHGKPTLISYARKVCIHHSRNSTNTRFNIRTRQEAKSKKKTLFWRLWQFSRSHLNTASWKNNKFNGTLCQNEETSQTENLRKHKFLTALKLRRTDISLVWLRHVKTSYTCNAQQISALKISLALMITYQLYSRVI